MNGKIYRRVTWLIAMSTLLAWPTNSIGAHSVRQVAAPPGQLADGSPPAKDAAVQEDQPKSQSSGNVAEDPASSTSGAAVSDAPAASPRRPTFDKQSAEILESLKPITEAVNRATVSISARGRTVALGTIVDGEGLILTKASELKNGLTCKLFDGRSFSAEVFGIHKKTDLALLKIDAKQLPVCEWSTTDPPAVGYWVVTPKVNENPLLGIVSVKPREIAAPTGYIGVGLAPHDDGVRIDKVSANSPAEKAGLRVNDIIFEINGQKVAEINELRESIQKNPVGSEVTLKVLRAGETMEFKVQLTELSSFEPSFDRSNAQNEMGGRLSKRRLDFPMAIQHDTPLSPSECGGPLIDLTGKVVGVNIARAGRVDSLALPAATVLSAIESLKSGQLAPAVIHKAEIEKIQARLSQIAAESDQLPKRKTELTEQLNRDKARLEELQRVLKDVESRLKELEAEQARTSEQLNSANTSNSKLIKEKERLEAQLQALTSGTN